MSATDLRPSALHAAQFARVAGFDREADGANRAVSSTLYVKWMFPYNTAKTLATCQLPSWQWRKQERRFRSSQSPGKAMPVRVRLRAEAVLFPRSSTASHSDRGQEYRIPIRNINR
jgi:hypothetical protein